ncbi:MAG: hypothetical protein B7O98_01735 [Zestosphaera tikiterensis]|uniref:Uncharacterized protein n=1 Tax=Zestosphaera tikiterensis TaxID=1973259 RepID=A0A2R7Y6M3_9CREN|nr:MAG: hypothetical protein B7O98_01735 [Zestosphaera tikiterensis]
MDGDVMLNFVVSGKVRSDYVGFSKFVKLWRGEVLVLDSSSGFFKVFLRGRCGESPPEDFFRGILGYVSSCYMEVYLVVTLECGALSRFRGFLGVCSSVGGELRCVKKVGGDLSIFTQVRKARDGRLVLKALLLKGGEVFCSSSLTEISSLKVHLCDVNVIKGYVSTLCSLGNEVLSKVKELCGGG